MLVKNVIIQKEKLIMDQMEKQQVIFTKENSYSRVVIKVDYYPDVIEMINKVSPPLAFFYLFF